MKAAAQHSSSELGSAFALYFTCSAFFSLLFQEIELRFWREGVGGLLRISADLGGGGAADIAAGGTNAEGVLSGLGEPLAAGLVEGSKHADGNQRGSWGRFF